MDDITLFSKTRISRLFMTVSIPGTIGMIFATLYQIFDGVMVSRILGDLDFAALNLAFPFIIMNFAVADLIGVGSSVHIGIKLGEGDNEGADSIFTLAIIMIFLSGLAIGLLLLLSAPALFTLLGAEGELHSKAVEYLSVYAACSPVITAAFAVDNFLKICTKVRRSMVLNVSMSLFIIAAEFLMLKLFGFGLWAAALASCIGMMLMVLLALLPFLRGKLILKFRRPRLGLSAVGKIAASGLPVFLSNVSGRVVAIMMNAELLRLGGADAVSAYGILMYVDTFVFPLMYGLSDSLQPAISYNAGHGNEKRMLQIGKAGYIADFTVSILAFFMSVLLPDFLVGLFAQEGTHLYSIAREALILFSITYIFRWFPFFTQSFLNAVGNAAAATVLSVASSFVFPLVLLFALLPMGLRGLWLNSGITNILAAAAAIVLFRRFRRQKPEPLSQAGEDAL